MGLINLPPPDSGQALAWGSVPNAAHGPPATPQGCFALSEVDLKLLKKSTKILLPVIMVIFQPKLNFFVQLMQK